jgi:hypothetical protein
MNKIANIVTCQQQKIRKVSQKLCMESVKLKICVTKQFFFGWGEGRGVSQGRSNSISEFSPEKLLICPNRNLSFSVGYFWQNTKYLLQYFSPQQLQYK